MIVRAEILEKLFIDFSLFLERKDKEPFSTFENSKFVDSQENYKYSVYKEARNSIGQQWWKPANIGTGEIKQYISSAIKKKVEHNFQTVDNNLIDWRKKDDFAKRPNSRSLENTLYNFYKSKIKDCDSFQLLLDEKLSYQFIAYLFFIKDCKRFMPISQERFDQIFEILGITEFKTSGNVSWENYSTFNDIIKQVRDFLRTKDSNTTLLDAHSFLWIIGSSKFQNTLAQSSTNETVTSLSSKISAEIDEQEIAFVEEDEELSFPEGKEVFRLHKAKERNQDLVRAAKQKWLQIDKNLCCQVCGFSFSGKYGELGEGFIEAHHLYPISQLTEETETKVDDLALVCSNCHRMLHRRRPWLALEELKSIVLSGRDLCLNQ